MSILDAIRGRKKAAPNVDIPTPTRDVFVQAHQSGGDIVFPGGTTLFPYDSAISSHDIEDISGIAIRVIVNQALKAEFTRGQSGEIAMYNPEYTKRQFYQAIYSAILTYGNVLLYRVGMHLHFATGSLGLVDGVWQAEEYSPRTRSSFTRDVDYEKAVLLRWDMHQGDGYLSDSPLRLARPAANAYSNAMVMLQSYAERGNKVESVLKRTDNHYTPDEAAKYTKDVLQQLNVKGGNRAISIQPGFDFINMPTNAPAIRETIEESVHAVARVFGVPVQYLCVTQKGVRNPPEENADYLISEAVIPLLDTVADGLRHLLKRDIKVDVKMLQLSTWDRRVQTAKELAHTGAYQIRDIRDLTGHPRIPGDTEYPATAGAGDRTETSRPTPPNASSKEE